MAEATWDEEEQCFICSECWHPIDVEIDSDGLATEEPECCEECGAVFEY